MAVTPDRSRKLGGGFPCSCGPCHRTVLVGIKSKGGGQGIQPREHVPCFYGLFVTQWEYPGADRAFADVEVVASRFADDIAKTATQYFVIAIRREHPERRNFAGDNVAFAQGGCQGIAEFGQASRCARGTLGAAKQLRILKTDAKY